ncbi:hypothetical protein NC652_040486 [Populus alba x Populus x berolinensis]|nr:hypothetical protein NC652_040486 [Populus alba x Populus x berolinensis]
MISGLKCPQKYRYDQDSSIRSNVFARSDAVLTVFELQSEMALALSVLICALLQWNVENIVV